MITLLICFSLLIHKYLANTTKWSVSPFVFEKAEFPIKIGSVLLFIKIKAQLKFGKYLPKVSSFHKQYTKKYLVFHLVFEEAQCLLKDPFFPVVHSKYIYRASNMQPYSVHSPYIAMVLQGDVAPTSAERGTCLIILYAEIFHHIFGILEVFIFV